MKSSQKSLKKSSSSSSSEFDEDIRTNVKSAIANTQIVESANISNTNKKAKSSSSSSDSDNDKITANKKSSLNGLYNFHRYLNSLIFVFFVQILLQTNHQLDQLMVMLI